MEEHLKQHEGQLLKFTNVMKGWQNRWFILDPWTGVLEYYLSQQEVNLKPRGCIYLGKASVVPHEDDFTAFSIIPSSGETYKLKASDTRERQIWVDRLRAVVEINAQKPIEAIEDSQLLPGAVATPGCTTQPSPPLRPLEEALNVNMSIPDALASAGDFIHRSQVNYVNLVTALENLSVKGPIGRNVPDLLILKAISQSTLLCLEQCHLLLQAQAKKSTRKKKSQPSRLRSFKQK
ncbi:oxysterol-binding protein-related protein 11-like isoform X2 [Artemia franciscana]|uniref:oxysterol-binding protein-related protein 11-like isoform X2 n=1 Tax=Artemia franciscana TaxID=6661 RepID=UPI0032DAE59D